MWFKCPFCNTFGDPCTYFSTSPMVNKEVIVNLIENCEPENLPLMLKNSFITSNGKTSPDDWNFNCPNGCTFLEGGIIFF